MNLEPVLNEIANAIKHRCISTSHRWNIIFWQQRITCVPSYENVPPISIIGEFTENMVQKGFSTAQWSKLRQTIIEMHKELIKCNTN